MDGVPAPISMLVDPSTNPEAIALVGFSFSLILIFLNVILIFTQPQSSRFSLSPSNLDGHQVTETLMYDMVMGEDDKASPNWDPEMNW